MTEEAVSHVATRIRRTQDILERRIAIENPSCYPMFNACPSIYAGFTSAISRNQLICRTIADYRKV